MCTAHRRSEMLPCALLQGGYPQASLGVKASNRNRAFFYHAAGKDLEFTPFLFSSPALWQGVLNSELERSHHNVRCYRSEAGHFLIEQSTLLFWAVKNHVYASLHGRDGKAITLPSSSRNELLSYRRRHFTIYLDVLKLKGKCVLDSSSSESSIYVCV